MLCYKCDSKAPIMPKEPDTKIITINLDSVKLLKGQVKLLQDNARIFDSIGQIHKAKYLALKQSNRELITHHICDTIEVLKYYDATVNSCDSVIQSDSVTIATDKTIMQMDQSIIRKQSDIINEVQEHDNWQKSVNDILKKEVKKQKRTKIAVIFGAVLTTVSAIFLLK
ncbi:hypothetical protein [uncultured Clostridium sp.]|uniref:hypothetical protein n=1 Tax=uncultured Clostridium sp. TaxID=59620 RepID=UPI0026367C4A|nr:hypothetical protein [uncultured Clostridium sp.]